MRCISWAQFFLVLCVGWAGDSFFTGNSAKTHPILHPEFSTFKLYIEEIVVAVHFVAHFGIEGHFFEWVSHGLFVPLVNLQTRKVNPVKVSTDKTQCDVDDGHNWKDEEKYLFMGIAYFSSGCYYFLVHIIVEGRFGDAL